MTQCDARLGNVASSQHSPTLARSLDLELQLFAAEDPATHGLEDGVCELATTLKCLGEAKNLSAGPRLLLVIDEWPLKMLEAAPQDRVAFKTRATASAN
ncbi:hypothetical protein FRC12_013414 [Ceratobasidium sp. 428]|nr:hypothetical protein FRC12_013414 [Ceratobasidium sp. 428]